MEFNSQILDGKYRIERQLGRGGMGTVYLATHLGTERPVAVKIISPQYMRRPEFVERFRREARAAGRLRHPNVVNVTDFGLAETNSGPVAYLVMEYLDGCTLGEILEEEKRIPVTWTLDILEQVCSAVHEAHQQGIIHRDLKPDNIWLEPNTRGGYTVKVLDFGIAKLEEHEAGENRLSATSSRETKPTIAESAVETVHELSASATLAADVPRASLAGNGRKSESEAGTVLLAPGEAETIILQNGRTALHEMSAPDMRGESRAPEVSDGSRSLFESGHSTELTRVGAVLGTPLYMSPEQCRGEHLDPRSDIYSLGVIAYQMLSGSPPFQGDFTAVMEAHKTQPPPPLTAKGVRRKFRKAVLSALEKDPDRRPETAESFASVLRARSEGIWGLLRRALVIYSEHLPKFLAMTAFLALPLAVLSMFLVLISFLKATETISDTAANIAMGLTGISVTLASAFCTNLIVGATTWIVTQYLSVPLRPVRVRLALSQTRPRWKQFAGAGVCTAILPFVIASVACLSAFTLTAALLGVLYPVTGSAAAVLVPAAVVAGLAAVVGFVYSYISFILVAPAIMMERVGVFESLKRSFKLVRRSLTTSAQAVFIMFLMPALIAGTISFVVKLGFKAFDPKAVEPAVAEQEAREPSSPVLRTHLADEDINITIGPGRRVQHDAGKPKDMRARIKETLLESLIQIFWLPMQIFVLSFSAIIVALLYLKTRTSGGESLTDLIERFEDDGRPRRKWQERVRQRLIQSGRISSNG
jgi:serine/threonine protein kinase